MKKLLLIIGSILAVVIFASMLLYFCFFNGSFSENPNDWAAFGGYIGGLAAVLNVVVFVWLTSIIQKEDEDAKSRELLHRQSLVITQIRQDELRHLADVLSDATKVNLFNPQFYKFSNTRVYIMTFRDSYKVLFPILNEESFSTNIDKMCHVLNTMSGMAMESAGFDKKGKKVSDPKPLPNDFGWLEKSFQDLKIKILSELEQDILNNITIENEQ